MNSIFGKVKKIQKPLKLISDNELFAVVEVDANSCVDYDSDHNLDEDSWFKINEFSKKDYCLDMLKKDFDSKEFAELKKDQFCKISYLFAIQSDNFYFQKVTPSLFVMKKFIHFGDVAKIEESENRLTINNLPDAIYLKEEDTLIFKNLATISSIFKGIDQLYHEATKKEVEDFLKRPFINLISNFSESEVSKPNRKRIAMAIETLDKFSENDKHEILNYINDYCSAELKFNTEDKSFQISKDTELTFLLYGIEQRFYTTLYGNHERRLANSIVSMSKK